MRAPALFLLVVVLSGTVLLTGSLAIFAVAEQPEPFGVAIIGIVLGAGALAGGIVYAVVGRRSVCRECGRWWAAGEVGESLADAEKGYGVVRRHGDTEVLGPGGIAFGDHSWEERAPVVRETYLVHFGCQFCGARWSVKEFGEREDFNR